ncbi:MAG: RagB/SusD family nutrient uptake outer membrane protein [Bacteroidaceae bacterium]|nr:RagB/SusD family nutrient uptake outer membrane protein [Bacteroidaceae bacterium]
MKTKSIIFSALAAVAAAGFVSCSDLLSVDSKTVMYEEDNTLSHATDTVYSVMGIIKQMQKIADRTVILNEMRGDLVTTTDYATDDIRELYDFNFGSLSSKNKYDQPVDYYSVINNCNFYLSRADTTYVRNHENVFLREYVAVLSFRAWTYLQMAITYGKVPFIEEPILSGDEAEKDYPMLDVKQIAQRLIPALEPYRKLKSPMYGSLGGGTNGDGSSSESHSSEDLFIPVRLILGDLYLWAEDYVNAALCYHEFLTLNTAPVPTTTNHVGWQDKDFVDLGQDTYSTMFGSNLKENWICYIPMESEEYNGIVSDLENIFCSTEDNYYFYQLTRSQALTSLAAKQKYCYHDVNPNTHVSSIVYVDPDLQTEKMLKGDLRLQSVLTEKTEFSKETSRYSDSRQTLKKINPEKICLYRNDLVFLRLAEALNRAGLPQTAFAILKYGLCKTNIDNNDIINQEEKDYAKTLGLSLDPADEKLVFNENVFMPAEIDVAVGATLPSYIETNRYNTMGIHSRGCGDAAVDTSYVFPHHAEIDSTNLAARKLAQIRDVEIMISDEMALETCFEGYRFADLYRVAMHRGEDNGLYSDDEFLATRVASRGAAFADPADADFDAVLFDKLNGDGSKLNPNWFLRLPDMK